MVAREVASLSNTVKKQPLFEIAEALMTGIVRHGEDVIGPQKAAIRPEPSVMQPQRAGASMAFVIG